MMVIRRSRLREPEMLFSLNGFGIDSLNASPHRPTFICVNRLSKKHCKAYLRITSIQHMLPVMWITILRFSLVCVTESNTGCLNTRGQRWQTWRNSRASEAVGRSRTTYPNCFLMIVTRSVREVH